MGALQNAVMLMADPTWRQWLTAASAYTAREVYTEPVGTADHELRLRMALDVIVNPDLLTAQLVTIVSTDPEVAVKGGTPDAVGEALTIQKVGAIWTPLARWRYGA